MNWLVVVLSGIFLLIGNNIYAEPQFGGTVDTLFYCDCSNNWYVKVGSPHGGEYIKNNSTQTYDCEGLSAGEWILGMSTESMEDCEIVTPTGCDVVHSGEVIEYYGSSGCGGSTTRTRSNGSQNTNIKSTKTISQQASSNNINSPTNNTSNKNNTKNTNNNNSKDTKIHKSKNDKQKNKKKKNINNKINNNVVNKKNKPQEDIKEKFSPEGILDKMDKLIFNTINNKLFEKNNFKNKPLKNNNIIATVNPKNKNNKTSNINKIIKLILSFISLGVAGHFIYRASLKVKKKNV